MKKLIKIIIKMTLLLAVSLCLINAYMIFSTKNKILPLEKVPQDDIDCILILGASIQNQKPSAMLEDRLITGIKLYNSGISKKILVSGDHTQEDYDEVNVMKNYLIENGIPSEDIFMDHYGISSYDSIYRAKEIFKAEKIIIVTQKYHLYRSLYIANMLGIESYGVATDDIRYPNQSNRDIREFLARIKDFFKSIGHPSSKYLGEVYSIKGNGNSTNN